MWEARLAPDEAVHGLYLSRKALIMDFLPQQGDITAAILPVREHVGRIVIKDTAVLATWHIRSKNRSFSKNGYAK